MLATQNPIEQEGTYPLPEAQVDRFLLKVVIDYPTAEEEQQILRAQVASGPRPTIQPVVKPEALLAARELVREVYMDEKVERYIVQLVNATRRPENQGLGHLKPLIGLAPRPGPPSAWPWRAKPKRSCPDAVM